MTPQERAAAFIKSTFPLHLSEDGEPCDGDIEDVIAHDKETRRAALRDVLSDLDSLHWKEHWYADQLRKKINDRLVSEGA